MDQLRHLSIIDARWLGEATEEELLRETAVKMGSTSGWSPSMNAHKNYVNPVADLDAQLDTPRPKERISVTIFFILSILSAVVAAVQPGAPIFMVLGLCLGGFLASKHYGREYVKGL